MQTTQNCNLNLIDKEDKILDSLEALNTNFTSIDTILGTFEADMTNLIEGDGI